ncbi:DUF4405 domain-containing protein [Sulfurovum mangrovi]|uniref:DUF4405 domain-containing protein n=1 Tax=Sulfurovum mangrovi TaxID=2893889 RepID=UPI001E659689|nr:DUF4405 domain-containing protein [Sulfurovum mangrovi]UFH60142.1 DUF4405 domain-containing protein [Sulfurovum mangrovi]
MKKITSLTLAWMFLVSSVSGLMLFAAPPGRIAYWADWSLLGLTKTEWGALHIVVTLLMLLVAGLHLYYNWKPFTSYMKEKVTKAFHATKELVISLLIVSIVSIGAVTQLPPFGWIVDLSDYLSEEWEVSYGTPPYNHAELDSVSRFSQKLGFDLSQASKNLEKNGVTFSDNEPLLDIAHRYHTSPQHLYRIIKEGGEEREVPLHSGSGMGQKTLKQLCEVQGLDLKNVLQRLEKQGIKAEENEQFKEIAARNGMNPMDLLEIVVSKEKR